MDNFQKIIPYYTQPHRFYHNLEHLATMMRFNEYWKEEAGMASQEFPQNDIYQAILWHDSVYDILKTEKTNEVKSSILYQEQNPDFNITVQLMILATEHHFTDQEFDPVTSYFLDLDLCTFSHRLASDFLTVQENIDKEFLTEYSLHETYKGRLDFIQNSIVPHGRFRVMQKHNDNMKRNIEDLIERYTNLEMLHRP